MPLREPVPDLRALDLLKSVADLGSIRQAALAHHITQPAASMRLRSLERVIGLDLLDRSTGRARLTSSGEAVVQWGESVLGAMQVLLLGTAATRAKGRTHLRIVASMTAAEYLVPGWLSRLRVSDPGISVSLEMGNSERVVEVMKRRGADMGFVEGRSAPPGLGSRVVATDDVVVIVAPSHPWARRRRPLVAADLAAAPLVLREAGSGTREVFETALLSLGLAANPIVELGSTTAIKAAVTSGAGPGVLSRLATEAEVSDGRLIVVPTEGLALGRSIRVVWTRDRPISQLGKRLLRQVASDPR
ncbi:MAG TPA: LysR family transcriptional regulator [Candidatus Micrarchaeaceae archaeon]|nr:LysR family transcriptional regulator [Candidatus Micrarchaeaceae archaeon]